MRVWELAESLRITTAELLALIEPYDKYVTSHLATVPEMALRAIQEKRPEPTRKYGDYYWHATPPPPTRPVPAQPGTGRPGRNPFASGTRYRSRRKPGPAPVSFEPPYNEDDPIADLRYEPIWSTRDVARYLKIKTSTVRQWVVRGHLVPAGIQGTSYIFRSEDVYDANAAIRGRRNVTGKSSHRPDPQARDRELSIRELDRLTKVTPESLVNLAEAATMLSLAPSTIRAWICRGHLTPHHTSTPRRVLVTVEDLYRAACR